MGNQGFAVVIEFESSDMCVGVYQFQFNLDWKLLRIETINYDI